VEHGAVFAIMVQFNWVQARSRYKLAKWRKLVTVQEFGKWALAQYRGTILLGAGN